MKLSFRHIILFCISAFCASAANAQVRGTVYDASGNSRRPVSDAAVWWAGTNIGVNTDASGQFDIGRVKEHDILVAKYMGFAPDSIRVADNFSGHLEFNLGSVELEAVVVRAGGRGNYTELDGILKGEVISFAGLTKMACCNLAESFENSASVTVGYSDAITGARQIKMLGLSGVYTQILDESRPVMRGLGSQYGLSYTPGMWLRGIQLSKGITSVTGGHEAIAGQINLEFRKPAEDTPLFVNVYGDQDLRTELNLASSQKITDKLSTVFLLHGSMNPLRKDHNGDGFADMPTGRQVNIANRYLYVADNGIQVRGGFKYLNDARVGGQMDFDRFDEPREFDSEAPYGSEVANENANVYLKLAIPLGKYVYDDETGKTERSNIAFILDLDHFGTDSRFGQLRSYTGRQNSAYFNGMYSWSINTRHKLISGVSALSDSYDEYLDIRIYSPGELLAGSRQQFTRTHNEAGIYAEYSYEYRDRLSLIAGGRADYASLNGIFFTPRAHLKWNITPKLVLRGSAGLGYRRANILGDNIWVMATGRPLFIMNENGSAELSQESANSINTLEKSFTYGGSLSWHFRLGQDEGAALGFDFFRTDFHNGVIADQELDSERIYFYNLPGGSHTNTWQADFNWSPVNNFDVLLTFRYNDTSVALKRPDGSNVTVEKPLTDRYKGLINLQYATRFRKWVFDFTAQINGPSRLPSLSGDPSDSEHSPAYPIFYLQITHRLSARTSVYAGCENIADYVQHYPITWQGSVYDTSFNSSRVWGPLMGRTIYLGARITF